MMTKEEFDLRKTIAIAELVAGKAKAVSKIIRDYKGNPFLFNMVEAVMDVFDTKIEAAHREPYRTEKEKEALDACSCIVSNDNIGQYNPMGGVSIVSPAENGEGEGQK